MFLLQLCRNHVSLLCQDGYGALAGVHLTQNTHPHTNLLAVSGKKIHNIPQQRTSYTGKVISSELVKKVKLKASLSLIYIKVFTVSLLSKISVNDTIVKSFNIVFHHFNVHSVKTVSGTDDLLMVPNSNFLFFFLFLLDQHNCFPFQRRVLQFCIANDISCSESLKMSLN